MFEIHSHHLLKFICVFHFLLLHNVCIISKLFFVIQFLVFPCPLLSSSFSSSESVSYSTIKTLNVLFFTAIFVSKGISKLQPKKRQWLFTNVASFSTNATNKLVQHYRWSNMLDLFAGTLTFSSQSEVQNHQIQSDITLQDKTNTTLHQL